MRIRKLGKKHGFTLVELMIVVAIIGILAALAIYGVKKYLTNAKTGEAKANLGRLGKDAVSAYERESMAAAVAAENIGTASAHALCDDVAADTPGVPKAVPKGQKIQPNPDDWKLGTTASGWRCLKFSLNSPVYYQYSYASSDIADPVKAAFTVGAKGDLDGDGTVFSQWTYEGKALKGAMRLATTVAEPADPEE